ncbi:MAG: hypothetical protein ACNYNX_00645 [Leucobacter sp.]
MDRDVAKLQGIARDLSELGVALSNRIDPPDVEMCHAIGEAFVALSEAIADITTAAVDHGSPSLEDSSRA